MSTMATDNGSRPLAANSIADFLKVLAAKTPSPGGGCTAALAGALAAAQAQMVVEYSIGKKSLAAHQTTLTEYRQRLENIRVLFLRLMDEDAAAYAQLSPWLKQAPAERGAAAAFQSAVIAALRAPQTTLALANELLECCFALAQISNPVLVSDLRVAEDIAAACGRSALRNVDINLPLLPNAQTYAQERAMTDELSAHLKELIAKIA